MPTLSEMKQSSPAYQALTDEEFAERVYQKHYASIISREEFDRRTAPANYGNELIGGFSRGFNEGVDALINLPGSVMNLGAGALGYDAPFEPVRVASRANVMEKPRTGLGRISQAVGEVAGSAVVPQAGLLARGAAMAPQAAKTGSAISQAVRDMAQRARANPQQFMKSEAATTLAAGTGIGLAREAETGPVGELAAGLAAPAVAGLAARTGGALRDAAGHGNRMIARARDPQFAADQDVADAVTRSGVDVDDLRQAFSPTPSKALRDRGFTDADLADIIARRARNEPSANIARDYRHRGKQIAAGTVDNYVRKHREMSPTPRNIADAVTDLAGPGAARPVNRLGRAAAGIADDADTTQALIGRQEVQGGRVNMILSKAAGGSDYDATVAALDDVLTKQARKAYGEARKEARPFNLRPAIRSVRDAAFKSAGSIREGLEKAADLFFEPVMEPSGKIRKIGQPIGDMKRYQAAREALDDMIQKSFENNRPTRLTARLGQFRKHANNIMRNANPKMADTDDLYSGAKTAENLLKQGAEITTRLGARAETALKGFSRLKPEQKEIVRQGFLHRLANMADNPQDGRAIANQFQSEAVRKIIRKLFGADARLAARDNSAIRRRGETLIKELRQEATTTRTTREFLSGSRTAEYAQDMNKVMQGAQTAADLASGRWGTILANLSNRLAYQIGERQARAIMQTLTETEPAKLLPALNRLARQAQTRRERMDYVHAIRELRKASVGAMIGTGVTIAGD